MIENARLYRERRALIVALLACGSLGSLPGQTPPDLTSGAAPVAKYSNLIFTVGKLETSVAFYRDLIGLDVLSLKRGAAGDTIVGPYVAKVSGSPAGVVFSSAILSLPGAGFNLLLTEFGNVNRMPHEAKVRETGATTLVLIVGDLDPPFVRLKKAGARIVTKGGAPVVLPDHSRSVVLRDTDGFLVQLIESGNVSKPEFLPGHNILSAHVRRTVSRLDETIAFYRSVLGFELSPTAARVSDPSTQRLLDVPRAEWRQSAGGLPGGGKSFDFIEYEKAQEASPVTRLRDPGTPAFSISVRNMDASLTAMRAAGAPIVSEGGGAAVSPNGGRNVFVRDPSGFFLELEGPLGR